MIDWIPTVLYIAYMIFAVALIVVAVKNKLTKDKTELTLVKDETEKV